MEVAYSTLLQRPTAGRDENFMIRSLSRDGAEHPRIIRYSTSSFQGSLSESLFSSLGGDHTIVGFRLIWLMLLIFITINQVLPILRSLKKIYGPISVIHFDAHLVCR
jgi:agmatinase